MQAYLLINGAIQHTTQLAAVRQARASGKKIWLDLESQTAELDQLLRDDFGIHPLVIEDIWADRSIPKLDEFPEYLYVIMHGVKPESTAKQVEMWTLDVVFGTDFVITQHSAPGAADKVRDRLMTAPRLLENGAAWLAHAFIDDVVDHYRPIMDSLGKALDAAEHDVLVTSQIDSGERNMLPELFALKRSINALHRITDRQRDVLEELSEGEFEHIPKEAKPYFRDVEDHFTRAADRVGRLRDLIADITDAFIGVQSNRMNATVKRLTLVSTMLVPLTLVTGFYGMNFKHMPELEWQWGELYALGLLITVALGFFLVLKKKKWF